MERPKTQNNPKREISLRAATMQMLNEARAYKEN